MWFPEIRDEVMRGWAMRVASLVLQALSDSDGDVAEIDVLSFRRRKLGAGA